MLRGMRVFSPSNSWKGVLRHRVMMRRDMHSPTNIAVAYRRLAAVHHLGVSRSMYLIFE